MLHLVHRVTEYKTTTRKTIASCKWKFTSQQGQGTCTELLLVHLNMSGSSSIFDPRARNAHYKLWCHHMELGEPLRVRRLQYANFVLQAKNAADEATARAGGSYFSLVRPSVLMSKSAKALQARGAWGHAPPGKVLKLSALRSLLRLRSGQNDTRILTSLLPAVTAVSEANWSNWNQAAWKKNVSQEQFFQTLDAEMWCGLAKRLDLASFNTELRAR